MRGLAKRLGLRTRESLLIAPDELLGLVGYPRPEPRPAYSKPRAVNRCRVSTGASGLDRLLGGGVEVGCVTELVGPAGSGKTQLCHQLAVMVQLPPSEGGLRGAALYVDTEGTFRPERVIAMAEYRGLDPEEALENIVYARVYSVDHQVLIARELEKVVEERGVKLVVVDSLVRHFRAELGRGASRSLSRLYAHSYSLALLAEEREVAVVVTNQVTEPPGVGVREFGAWAVVATHRVWLERVGPDRVLARLLSSPSLPPGEAALRVTWEGVFDAYPA